MDLSEGLGVQATLSVAALGSEAVKMGTWGGKRTGETKRSGVRRLGFTHEE